jgi:hypothetical protein
MCEEFSVDLSNPEEVSAKMPQLLRLYEEKLHEQKKLNQQLELLRRVVGHPAAIARSRVQPTEQIPDQPPQQPLRRRVAPAQDQAVAALERAYDELGGTAMGPTSLYKFMKERGMKTPNNPSALGANLYDAWKAGRIMRATNGVYIPLDGSGKTEVGRPLADYYYAAEQGFPVPSSWPPQRRNHS